MNVDTCSPPSSDGGQPLVSVVLANYSFYDYYNHYNPYDFNNTFDHLSDYQLPKHSGIFD